MPEAGQPRGQPTETPLVPAAQAGEQAPVAGRGPAPRSPPAAKVKWAKREGWACAVCQARRLNMQCWRCQ
eukprot:5321715-Alexandrium_andersonii.AAC.1